MHLVTIMLLFLGVEHSYLRPMSPSYAYPMEIQWNPVIHYEEPNNNYEYVGPAMIGEISPRVTRNSVPGTFDFVTHGLQAGLNFIDSLVPSVHNNAVHPIYTLKNFTRPRRHENLTTQFPSLITEASTTETILIVTPIVSSIMEDKVDVASSRSIKQSQDTTELQLMIKQLNNALHYIQEHGNEKIEEKITNATSTEKLVQYISSQVDMITKDKNTENRPLKIKKISKALEILLERIAKSAKPLLQTKSQEKPDPILMARIVEHIAELKKNVVLNKVNSGYELTSAELDGGLPAKFRPIRQGDTENVIDNNDDDDKDDQITNGNDVSKDVEQIPTKNVPSMSTIRPNEVTARQEQSSGQQSSSSEEGGGNLVANLLSSFLGSLSTPEGGVDVDAIVALVSGLSVQRDDGSFDFSGITDLLQSFLGGDGDEGGSDVGAFLGGLLGAILQGSANPPGAKGTGRLTGNLLANILPGLSGPPPLTSSEEAAGVMQQGKPIDSGSFLAGLLTSMLGASSGTSSGSGGHPMNHTMADHHKTDSASFFMKIKQNLFKSIFTLITSILGASSGGIAHASGASAGKLVGKH